MTMGWYLLPQILVICTVLNPLSLAQGPGTRGYSTYVGCIGFKPWAKVKWRVPQEMFGLWFLLVTKWA